MDASLYYVRITSARTSRRRLAGRERLVRSDCTLQVVRLHAGDQANLFQRRKLLLGLGRLPERQVELAEVLVGTAMTSIEQQGLLVMLHCRPRLTQSAIGIADVVLDVGVARVAQRRELERGDRAVPILGDQRLLACREVRI